MPVGRVSRQTRDLQPQHHTGLPERDLVDQLLESIAPGSLRSRFTEIAVNHMDLLARPALSNGTISESIFALCALRVFLHLAGCRLADVAEDQAGHKPHQ